MDVKRRIDQRHGDIQQPHELEECLTCKFIILDTQFRVLDNKISRFNAKFIIFAPSGKTFVCRRSLKSMSK